jgi:hypothetical protein
MVRSWGAMSIALAMATTMTSVASVTFAEEAQVAEMNSVTSTVERPKKFGVYASLGNPFPTVFGLNAAYNVSPHLRAMAGYGEVSVTSSITITDQGVATENITAKTYAAGAEYLFLDTPLRPAAGLHAGYFQVDGKGDISVNGFNSSSGYAYANIGADWVSQSGLQVGAGINMAFLGTSSAGMYLDSGWYF